MARTGARGGTAGLLALTVIVVGGFLFWLNNAASNAETTVAPELSSEGDAEPAVFTVTQLRDAPGSVIGLVGELETVAVEQRLGRGAFSVWLDSTSRYPVFLSNDLIARGTEVYGQDRVSLYGHFFTLNDSIRAEWVAQQAVDEANAAAIPQTRSFLLADSLSFVQQ
ncbi:MAG: hypothetical protein ACE5HF_09345 [Gemmatimonadota bacterium]